MWTEVFKGGTFQLSDLPSPSNQSDPCPQADMMRDPEFASFLTPLFTLFVMLRDFKLPIAPNTACILITPRTYLQPQLPTEV